MMFPENKFKEQLFNLETPLGDNVSFEKVMAMRKSGGAAIWWKPSLIVVATLIAVSVTGFFLGNNASVKGLNGTQAATNNKADANTASTPGSSLPGGSQAGTMHPQGNTPSASHSTPGGHDATGNSSSNQPSGNMPAVTSTTGSGIHTSGGTSGTMDPIEAQPSQDNSPIRVYEPAGSLLDGLTRKGIRGRYSDFHFAFGNQLQMEAMETKLPGTSRWAVEAMLHTGANNYRDFKNGSAYSLRGTSHFGQYSVSALYNLTNGWQLSAGLGYTEILGNGEWRKVENQQKTTINSHVITIVQPGLPNTYKTVYDTSVTNTQVATVGNVNYQLSKWSIPVGFRYHFGSGRVAWRIGGIIAPGMLVGNSGSVFNREKTMTLGSQTKRVATLDSRITFGIYVPLSKRLSLVAEPSLMYQSFLSTSWSGFNKLSGGFGIGFVFKP